MARGLAASANAVKISQLRLPFRFRPAQTEGIRNVSSTVPLCQEVWMLAPLRILSLAAFLIADAILPTGALAENTGSPPSSSARATHWRTRYHHRWTAPDELVAGVRGATPLTVPFFGFNWYPGPVHYFGPPPATCACRTEDAISARY
jgi:hypothetical protein